MLPPNIKNCEDEQLHLIESVQSFGYLFAVEPETAIIQAVSENVHDAFSSAILPGTTSLTDVIDMPENSKDVLTRLYSETGPNRGRHAYEWKFVNGVMTDSGWQQHVSSVVYAAGDYLILELEPTPTLSNVLSEKWKPTDTDIRSLLPNLFNIHSLSGVADAIAETVRKFIGFDRVVVYQFDKTFCGEVIGESCHNDLPSFKGLRFPASDIPSQARALYVKNTVRCIYDVNEQPVPLIPSLKSSSRTPVDLSQSMVRAVSPIHLQYLRNMGVEASFSISLVFDDNLWGMIACHHRQPKYVDQRSRLVCESLSEIFTWQLHGKKLQVEREKFQERQRELNKIVNSLTHHKNPLEAVSDEQQSLLDTIDACGVAIVTPNSHYLVGQTPTFETISHLFHTYSHNNADAPVALTRISDEIIANFKLNGVRGLFISPVSSRHGYYTMWFREAVDKSVRWAGKEASTADINKSLTPRNSFDTYIESVVDEGVEWTEDDKLLIEGFDHLFIPYALGMKNSLDSQVLKLEELDKAKDQFLASISHELRTPLNSILGWADLALMDPHNHERVLEAMDVVKRAASTQASLINDILDVSRIISGTLKLSTHSISIKSTILDVLKQFEAGFNAKNIHVNVAFSDEDTTILGDKVRIKQVVHNLLANALKFTPKGGNVSISGKREHSNYKFSVRDNGKGIDREQLTHIFERFYQGKASHRKQGLGLGLSIVKSIVELHGGDIWASSEGEGMGTVFYVALPIAPVANKPSADITTSEKPTSTSDRLKGLKILAAEDEEDSRKFIKFFLENHGASVSVAKNGLLAWKILNETPESFNLILSDIGMPELDGLGFITKVRNSDRPEIKHFSAVALTAYAYTSDRVKALKAGFSNYVSKPVDADELLTILELYKP